MGFCNTAFDSHQFYWPLLRGNFAVVVCFSDSYHHGEVAMVASHSLVRSLGLTFEFRCGFLPANEKMKQKIYFLHIYATSKTL